MKLDGPIAHLVDKADRETLQGSLETRVAEVSSKSITRHRPFADPLFHAQGKHHVGRRLGRQALTSNSESDIYKTERDGETSLRTYASHEVKGLGGTICVSFSKFFIRSVTN